MTPIIPQTLKTWIFRQVEAADESQSYIEVETDMAQGYLSAAKKGRKNPGLAILCRLAAYFGWEVNITLHIAFKRGEETVQWDCEMADTTIIHNKGDSKLPLKDRMMIRQRYINGENSTRLAKLYNVSPSTVLRITYDLPRNPRGKKKKS